MGIMINPYKDPYQTTSIMESKRVFFVAQMDLFNLANLSTLNCSWWVGRLLLYIPRSSKCKCFVQVAIDAIVVSLGFFSFVEVSHVLLLEVSLLIPFGFCQLWKCHGDNPSARSWPYYHP